MDLVIMKPTQKAFVDHLNVFDCSKVSDGASAIAVVSEEGLKKIGVDKKDAVEVVGWAQVIRNITGRSYRSCRIGCYSESG